MPFRNSPSSAPEAKNSPQEIAEALELANSVAKAMEDLYQSRTPGVAGQNIEVRYQGQIVTIQQRSPYSIKVVARGEAFVFQREGNYFELNHVEKYNPQNPNRAGRSLYRVSEKGEVSGSARDYSSSARVLLDLIEASKRPEGKQNTPRQKEGMQDLLYRTPKKGDNPGPRPLGSFEEDGSEMIDL